MRSSPIRTFVHMHELSLRFHLERTGGLSRVIERGRNGIETHRPLRHPQLVPTILEFGLLICRAA